MLTIRTATDHDAPLIASLIGRSFMKQAETLGISELTHPHYVAFETETRVRARMAGGANVVLGYLDDELIGTVSWLGHEDGSGEILRLAVLPSHRGNGYGLDLMTHAETQLVASGLGVGEVSIVAQFQRLQAYYERLGYRAHEFRTVHHLPFQLLFMRKVLASS